MNEHLGPKFATQHEILTKKFRIPRVSSSLALLGVPVNENVDLKCNKNPLNFLKHIVEPQVSSSLALLGGFVNGKVDLKCKCLS